MLAAPLGGFHACLGAIPDLLALKLGEHGQLTVNHTPYL